MPDPRTSELPVWKIHAERALLLGWGRALLLQLAHPKVAAGVAQHSRFYRQRYGGLRRLRSTLGAMLALSYAPEQVPAVARRINRIHDRVNGRLAEGTAHIPAGSAYSAHDPELLRWVHATLIDSFLVTYERFVGPLTAEEQDRYCADSRAMEQVVGLPPGFLPGSVAELRAYIDGMFASGEIAVTGTARMLARPILWPDAPLVLRPFGAVTRLATLGLLPPDIRVGYGLRWTSGQAYLLDALAWLVRHGLPLVPGPLRYWRIARRADPEAAQPLLILESS